MDTDLAITPGGRVGDASPLGKPGGPRKLTDYTREIAHALIRSGHTRSQAIAIARGAQKRWARGGGKVRPQVRAAAAKSTVEQHVLDHVKTGKRDTQHSVTTALDVIDLGVFNEALHPRLHGKFTSKNRGAAKAISRTKVKPPTKLEHSQRKLAVQIAKENERARAQARQLVARNNLHLKPLQHGVKPRAAFAPGGDGKFRPVRRSGAFTNTARADIELGWLADLHPRGHDGKFIKKGGEGEVDEETKSAEGHARKILEDAKEHEPEITSTLRKHSAANRGFMEALQDSSDHPEDFRFKTVGSLTRKIRDKAKAKEIPQEDYAGKVGDALRYTVVLPHENFTTHHAAMMKSLEADGHKVESVENTFKRGQTYAGINMNLISPTGQRYELQAHTPQSIHAKHLIHSDYEIVRSEDPAVTRSDKVLAYSRMVAVNRKLQRPTNVTKIGTQIFRPDPSLHNETEVRKHGRRLVAEGHFPPRR